MDAQVLTTSQRGHSPDETIRAMHLLKRYGCRIGMQMMVGLPGESERKALTSAQQMASLAPDFIRIYPCLVLRGSPLAQWYTQERYTPMSLEACISLVKQIFLLMHASGIAVIRMGLQPTTELNAGAGVLAGPFHPAFGELVYSALWLDAMRGVFASNDLTGVDLTIEVHPKSASRIRGHRNGNLLNLRREFNLLSIRAVDNAQLPHDRAMLNGISCPLITEE
jgi:histone acetyltransferase (RNA polymerase elongator complex component)